MRSAPSRLWNSFELWSRYFGSNVSPSRRVSPRMTLNRMMKIGACRRSGRQPPRGLRLFDL
jgi:hypothetical protein